LNTATELSELFRKVLDRPPDGLVYLYAENEFPGGTVIQCYLGSDGYRYSRAMFGAQEVWMAGASVWHTAAERTN
jgi:hypothetical protein